MKTKEQKAAESEWPTYWFARFEKAVTTGDVEAAKEAKGKLKDLGYDVRRKAVAS